MKAYAVYDKAAGAYLPPFYQQNDLVAIRTFARMVNDKKSIFSQSPEDFQLFFLAHFDESEGMFTQDKGPVPIRSALSLVVREVDEGQFELPQFTKGDGSYSDYVKERVKDA